LNAEDEIETATVNDILGQIKLFNCTIIDYYCLIGRNLLQLKMVYKYSNKKLSEFLRQLILLMENQDRIMVFFIIITSGRWFIIH